ncbi:Elongation factor 1-beta [Golovinomyces cichoracearum]|uniref:Elongation factor 1-beta n=1 Tax=Golovinomyces cichoracearum TaxID=62708 RepID=A0A420IZQ2_9PEZI|nr:Elongation factor 1-beta [Golovinomyces cichoracearum]
MGFTDLTTESGLQSKILSVALYERAVDVAQYSPSQADVVTFKALKSAPSSECYQHAARWYRHIDSYKDEFSSLPGDSSKEYSAYGGDITETTSEPVKKPEEEDEDEVDLFGSDDEEDAEAERIRNERIAEYKKKKEGKVLPAAKSIATIDIKPWSDETDLKALETAVRAIEKDGLVWGASKLVPIGFGIKKLQINLVMEDAKVGLDDLQEEIEQMQDFVQSTDIAAMQKL